MCVVCVCMCTYVCACVRMCAMFVIGVQGYCTYCATSHLLQVTRPDGKTDSLLGKTVLYEPKTNQSDPNVLDLQLRATAKQPNIKPVVSYVLHKYMLPYCTFMHMRMQFCALDLHFDSIWPNCTYALQ